MRNGILGVRWRLVIGLLSLAVAVVLTLPGGGSRLLQRPVSGAWPNPDSLVDETTWPNTPLLNQVIWPNAVIPD